MGERVLTAISAVAALAGFVVAAYLLAGLLQSYRLVTGWLCGWVVSPVEIWRLACRWTARTPIMLSGKDAQYRRYRNDDI